MADPPRGPRVVAARTDQLGSRLSAIVNGLALADRMELPFAFAWPPEGGPELRDPGELFRRDYLDRVKIESASLLNRRWIPGSALAGRDEATMRKMLARLPPGHDVRISSFSGVSRFGETSAEASHRFTRAFEGIGWNPVAGALIERCSFRTGPLGLPGVHVRGGSVVAGPWRHQLSHEKYTPSAFIDLAIEHLTEQGSKPVLVVSDSPDHLAWLRHRWPSIVLARDIVAGYDELTEVQRALADILALSRCHPVVGSRMSAFRLLAVDLGGGRGVRAEELAAGRELDVLRAGIAQRAAEARGSALWAPRVSRDCCWCVDVFADVLALEERAELIDLAVELEPDFAGAWARRARLGAMRGEVERARVASAKALTLAERVEVHADPLAEALASDVAVRAVARHAGLAREGDEGQVTAATRRLSALAPFQMDLARVTGALDDLWAARPPRLSCTGSRLVHHREAELFDPVLLDLELLAGQAVGGAGSADGLVSGP